MDFSKWIGIAVWISGSLAALGQGPSINVEYIRYDWLNSTSASLDGLYIKMDRDTDLVYHQLNQQSNSQSGGEYNYPDNRSEPGLFVAGTTPMVAVKFSSSETDPFVVRLRADLPMSNSLAQVSVAFANGESNWVLFPFAQPIESRLRETGANQCFWWAEYLDSSGQWTEYFADYSGFNAYVVFDKPKYPWYATNDVVP